MLDSTLFADVADAIGLSNPTIVEKDYYVVQLLLLVKRVESPHHDIIFSGGTALAKSAIKTYRMSEDVDLKCVPNTAFEELTSRNERKKARQAIRTSIVGLLEQSEIFTLEGDPIIRDEYRYMCFEIKYPQAYKQAPCLRPYIKLEIIESVLLGTSIDRPISSLYSQASNNGIEINSFACTSIIATQAEKIISMLRRTASRARSTDRDDDETLIRHIYDTYHIQLAEASDIDELSALINKVIKTDIERYGNQHSQMVESPLDELRYALTLLESEIIHKDRYGRYVEPMVYAENKTKWEDAFQSFKSLVEKVFQRLDS